MNSVYPIIFLLMLSIPFTKSIQAASPRHVVETQQIRMVVIPRSMQQMAAFYEGREFPAMAINATRDACFFTIGIHNKSQTILWLDTDNWEFRTRAQPLSLLSRSEWRQRWEKLELEQRFQSTFRWTLLPNQLDFQIDEREGGNITLARTAAPFTLSARFATGPNKKDVPLTIVFKDLRCADEPVS